MIKKQSNLQGLPNVKNVNYNLKNKNYLFYTICKFKMLNLNHNSFNNNFTRVKSLFL
jgi:hypothetical protein